MSLFDVNKAFIQQRLPELGADYTLLADTLNLDPAHMQLLADCYRHWREQSVPTGFWLYALLLVDEVNRGSSCLDLSAERFQRHRQLFNLPDWQTLAPELEQLTLSAQPVFVYHDGRLYFEKYHRAEQLLQQQIQTLTGDFAGQQFPTEAVKKVLSTVISTLEYPLNPEQIQAVITALVQSFSLVSGGPGTGKTTMLATVLRCFQLLGLSADDMALAAPTGRAAYRMTESLRLGLPADENDETAALAVLEAQTIHRLIGKSPRFNQSNRYHSHHPLPHKLIIIDEASMVDLQLMTELLAAVAADCRLILVGDQFQLPSVESGAVLADLMPPAGHHMRKSQPFAAVLAELMAPFVDKSPVVTPETDDQPSGLLQDNCTVLTQSHRSVAAIQNISEHVRQGDNDGFFNHPALITAERDTAHESVQSGVVWRPQDSDAMNGLKFIWSWFKQHIDLDAYHQQLADFETPESNVMVTQHNRLDRLFEHINRQQILTLVNRGRAGQETINRYLCQQIKQHWNLSEQADYFHGQVVMVRHNDYDKQLFNGDTGVVMHADTGWQVVFPGVGGYRSFALSLLPAVSTAFAITVHKSQGSEYRHVLLPLPDDINNPLLSREMIYTGMTRAKASVMISGQQTVLSQAIRQHSERQSGLQFW